MGWDIFKFCNSESPVLKTSVVLYPLLLNQTEVADLTTITKCIVLKLGRFQKQNRVCEMGLLLERAK